MKTFWCRADMFLQSLALVCVWVGLVGANTLKIMKMANIKKMLNISISTLWAASTLTLAFSSMLPCAETHPYSTVCLAADQSWAIAHFVWLFLSLNSFSTPFPKHSLFYNFPHLHTLCSHHPSAHLSLVPCRSPLSSICLRYYVSGGHTVWQGADGGQRRRLAWSPLR